MFKIIEKMQAILQTEQKSLKDFLNSFEIENIQYRFGALYERANDYYFEGKVKDIQLSNDNHLKASVFGQRKYKVNLHFESGEIRCECSCPMGDGICKHTLATLIHTQLEEWCFEEILKQSEFNLNDYLQKLSKEELIELVLVNQSSDLIQKLQNKTLSQDDLKLKVIKATKELEKLFDEIDWDTDIQWIDEKLVSIFKIFDGGWTMIVEEVTNLFRLTLTKINEAIEEGQLYDHYSDETFSGTLFSTMVIAFIKSISTKDKINVIQQLEGLQSEYLAIWNESALISEFFTSIDKPYLKKALVETSIPNEYITVIYSIVKNELNKDENEVLLKKYALNSQKLLLEYAELLEKKFLLKDVELLIQDYFDRFSISEIEEEVLKKWITIKNYLKESFKDKVNLLLTNFPNKENLQLAVTLITDCQIEFEKSVREKSFTEYILYLENGNRILEAENLISMNQTNWEDFNFQFYCRNSKDFPQKSTNYLINRIQKNLPSAGDSYYYEIAHTLKELFNFNPTKANELLAEIRITYKRRPNLMAILRGF